MNHTTIGHCLVLMNILGVNPKKIGNKIQIALFIFFLTQFLTLIYLVLMRFLKTDDLTIPEAIDIISNVLLQAHSVVYLVCFYVQRKRILQMLTDIEENFWKIEDYKVSEITSFYYSDVKMIRNKFVIYCGIMFLCTVTFNYGRIIKDKRPISDNLVFNAYIPEGLPFWGFFIWEHIQSLGCISMVISMDTLIFTIVSLTIIQIKMLRHEMRMIFEDGEENTSDCGERIKKCNDHHTLILSFSNNINDTFSSMILMYMVVILLMLCMEVYLIFLGNTLEEFMTTVCYFALLLFEFCFCYCFPAQELITQCQELPDSLYCTTWYKHMEHSKDVLMFLGKCQIGITVNVGRMVELDLQIGVAVLKTMISYSMFLRTMTMLSEE